MRSFQCQIKRLRISHFLSLVYLVWFNALMAQKENLLIPDIFYPGVVEDNDLKDFKEDTFLFHRIDLRFQSEVSRRGYINWDTFLYYGHLAIDLSKSQNYYQGLIRTYIGFGSGYCDKNQIDSSLYYSRMAIQYAEALKDTSLLSQAYLNNAWALTFKYKNEESLENALKSYRLAKESKDTSMLILINLKLGKIYSLLGQTFNEYKTYSESAELCKDLRDTNSLMASYFWLANLFYYHSMKSRHELVVKEALQYKDCITDNEALYMLNYLLVNWYEKNEQYDSMLTYSKKLIPLEKKLNRFPGALGRIASAYRKKDQLDSAKYFLEKFMLEKQSLGAYVDATTYLSIGSVEFELGNFSVAYEYFKKAEEQHNNSTFVRQQTFKSLYLYYDTIHQFTKAYTYLKDYTNLTDSIIESENRYREGIAITDLESYKLEERIDLLLKNSELQAALASKERQQKNMVYGSTALLLMMIGIGFIRYRKQKDLKSKQALVSDRLRISRELHDEVGATLSGIAMFSHVAKEQVKNERNLEAENSLTFMQKSAGEMVNKLSDIVWLINPEQDTILELIARLGEYGKQMTQASNMQMKMDLPAGLSGIHIPLEARRNIYLICKEAINNAVKYSHARFVELYVKMSGDHMVFAVNDDGNGFDLGSVERGNGLKNMQIRAKEIGAVFQMESSPYTGSRIELHYKIIQ